MTNIDIIGIEAARQEVGEQFLVKLYSAPVQDRGKRGSQVSQKPATIPEISVWGKIRENNTTTTSDLIEYDYRLNISGIAGYIPVIDDVFVIEGRDCYIYEIKINKVGNEVYSYDMRIRS